MLVMVVQEKVIVVCASVKHAKMKFGESFVSEKKTCDDRERGSMVWTVRAVELKKFFRGARLWLRAYELNLELHST